MFRGLWQQYRYVRLGSKTEVTALVNYVRSSPKSRHAKPRTSGEKKLPGAAFNSFMKQDAAAACDVDGKSQRLAGAALDSHMMKCIAMLSAPSEGRRRETEFKIWVAGGTCSSHCKLNRLFRDGAFSASSPPLAFFGFCRPTRP
jgi:hypothetical protein